MASYPLGVAEPVHVKRFDRTLAALRAMSDPLRRLDAMRRSREELEQLEAAAVADARAAGVTWTQIGALYGLSKQGRSNGSGPDGPRTLARNDFRDRPSCSG